jgi:hypothetical protein
MPLRNLINETSTKGNYGEKELDDDIVKQFKLIITVVFIILILSLLYFVYNLIKCYLPKWRRGNVQEDQLQSAKILAEPKKEEGPVTELF